MISVYAIKSIKRNYIYIGMSSEVEIRFKRHNVGKNLTTRAFAPFKLIYSKEFQTFDDAREHEKYLKTGVGREYLKKLI